MSREGNPSLDLHGILHFTNDAGEMVSRPFDLNVMMLGWAQTHSGYMEMNKASTLMQMMNLQMQRLVENVPNDMWMKAMERYPEGTIAISQTSNPELYEIMLQNLQTMIRPTSGDPGPGPAEVDAQSQSVSFTE
jgi:hypothetical protein